MKKSPIFFFFLDKNFFFQCKSLPFSNPCVTIQKKLFWKFTFFFIWTKKKFFNVNPYHFQTHAWLYRTFFFFFNLYLPSSCVFFQKKKKNFFFPGPKILKKPCEESTKSRGLTTSQALSGWKTKYLFPEPKLLKRLTTILRPFLESSRSQKNIFL